MNDKQLFTFRLQANVNSPVDPRQRLPNYPVEIYNNEMRLKGRGTLHGGVKLWPGREYYISAILPDGRRLSAHMPLNSYQTEVDLTDHVKIVPPQAIGDAVALVPEIPADGPNDFE